MLARRRVRAIVRGDATFSATPRQAQLRRQCRGNREPTVEARIDDRSDLLLAEAAASDALRTNDPAAYAAAVALYAGDLLPDDLHHD